MFHFTLVIHSDPSIFLFPNKCKTLTFGVGPFVLPPVESTTSVLLKLTPKQKWLWIFRVTWRITWKKQKHYSPFVIAHFHPFLFFATNLSPGVSPETFVSVSLTRRSTISNLQLSATRRRLTTKGNGKRELSKALLAHPVMRKSRIFRGQPRGSGDGVFGSFFCSPLNPPFLEVEPCIYSRLFMEGGYLYLPLYLPILQNSRMKEI